MPLIDVEVSFTSTPPGAQVWIGAKGHEQQGGVTPLRRSFPVADESVRVMFVLDGFNAPVRTVKLAPGAAVNVKLRAR